ncbi:MAG: DUF4249 domain-containing protein [Cytophagales bacterium]|nr:MAG: DUF4249 domain-containing protein [Cytophagales bacterium]
MNKRLKLYFLFLMLLGGCIDPFPVEVPEGEQLLTVDALIHSGPGPHRVTLTRSATYGSSFEALIRPITGATVLVRDQEGKVVFLTESEESRGSYFTPADFSAEVGKSYTLFIETPEGKLYSSFPERVEAVPPIQNLQSRTLVITQPGGNPPRSGVQLIAEIDDPADQNNYYFWRTGPAVYILQTRPDLFTPRPTETNPSRDPQPKDCCSVCYRTEISNNQSLFIAVDDDFNGLNTRVPVAFIEDDGLRFLDTYRVDVSQYGISQEAYRFLRLVKQQAEISGSIFDPPPATIRGNMISLDDPDEVVLGYFMAASEQTSRIYVRKDELSFVQNQSIIPDDCREVPGAVVDAPLDWRP